ncbi:MAG: hypothetical protein P0Y65_17405 [Candidatus Devosia phytovorans]|uniref:Lysine-specific metallo-endopeptidase domain-containing protein n=1 Tax=Candidatus Devosia phytovorans TaxID=3121372 RepID=A0AAJ5VTM0_9HYPH|nr:hypothetical protein [Devosia sp.]WEK03946.1 MAG: hypothetical protein P0Y65_17405 [Devosia sp.]
MRLKLMAFIAVLCCVAVPVQANDAATLERALGAATDTFEAALPKLGQTEFGVDVAAYRDALTLQQFRSSYWGGTVDVALERRAEASGSCGRFAAFVRVPPENGTVRLVTCPQFFTPDADALRELTILHEMVHVVAGTDECQAMAFAAKVEMAAKGSFTPVSAYWQASGCAGGRYALP